MKKIFTLGVCLATMIACTPTKQSTIDETLQSKVDSILQNKIEEIGASSGHAIVMEVQTGEIKAMIGNGISQNSVLIRTASLLAALETGKVRLSDTIDVGEGMYKVQDSVLCDHNWRRGGYGIINALSSLKYHSSIGIYKLIEKAFDEDQTYFDMLDKMSYGMPQSIVGLDSLESANLVTPKDSVWTNTTLAWSCNGYSQNISPIQTLTFYNAIANDGKMVKPTLFKGETEIINPLIADKANIDSIQIALIKVVNEGLGRRAQSTKVQVAGNGGKILTKNDVLEKGLNEVYNLEFCGYFPADAPKYSLIVSMNKSDSPVTGAMASEVFAEIVDYMMATTSN